MTYLELFKANREIIISNLEKRVEDVKGCMMAIVKEYKNTDCSFLLESAIEDGQTEKEFVLDIIDIIAVPFIMNEGTRAATMLEEKAIETSKQLMK